MLRRAAATAARQAVQLARLDQDPVVVAALAAAEAGQAVRAALFADSRTALYATLEQLRYLPGDPWMTVRAAALGVLRSGSAAGPPVATDH